MRLGGEIFELKKVAFLSRFGRFVAGIESVLLRLEHCYESHVLALVNKCASLLEELAVQYTIIPIILIVVFSPLPVLYLLFALPFPLNTVLTIIIFVAFSFTSDLRYRR